MSPSDHKQNISSSCKSVFHPPYGCQTFLKDFSGPPKPFYENIWPGGLHILERDFATME